MDFIEIIQRAKNILINPAEEWKVIKEESTDRSGVIRSYALPFISLLAITTFLGMFIFRNYMTAGIMVTSAIVTFIGAFLSIYISAYFINELASSFESKKDLNSSFKLVVYSYTALLISHAIANLLLPLFFIAIFGVYSAYIMWMGLGPMMETPEEKKVVYGTISSLTILVVYLLMNTLLGALSTSLFVSYGMNTLT